jgi:hypothetical protein
MNLGGKDIELLGRCLDDDVDVIARYFFQFWPDMVVEQPDGVSRYDATQDALKNFDETFLYKDMATFEEIERLGVTEELDNQMIAVTRNGSEVTLVVGLNWDCAPLIAYYYRSADEHDGPTA